MKWGVRRYQNKDGSLTTKGRAHLKSRKESTSINKNVGTTNVSGSSIAIALTPIAFHLSVFALARYGIERAMRNSRRKVLDDMYDDREFDTLNDIPRLKKATTPEQNMKATNPGYPEMGRMTNCVLCTAAMAMREKGYDVQAAKSDDGFYSDDTFKKLFNAKTEKIPRSVKNRETLESHIQKNGEGSYGDLSIVWKIGGGHSLFWKVEKGKVRVYDGQSGEEVTKSNREFNTYLRNVKLKRSIITRLDNIEPNESVLGVLQPTKRK